MGAYSDEAAWHFPILDSLTPMWPCMSDSEMKQCIHFTRYLCYVHVHGAPSVSPCVHPPLLLNYCPPPSDHCPTTVHHPPILTNYFPSLSPRPHRSRRSPLQPPCPHSARYRAEHGEPSPLSRALLRQACELLEGTPKATSISRSHSNSRSQHSTAVRFLRRLHR